ncbi:hypothetical protein, partial [Klebsiella pneumoniae]|uniref:hypothetical protein n=1 Tax=Klebsiella pneumoniae TaxID=573 RepID=UPI00126D33F5
VRTSFAAFGRSGEAAYGSAPRTERDLPSRWISLITLALVAVLVGVFAAFLQPAVLSPGARWGLGAYAVVFAFF